MHNWRLCPHDYKRYEGEASNCLSFQLDIQLSRDSEHRATALIYGAHGWLYRWHVLAPFAGKFGLSFEPDIIPWNAVDRFEHPTVTLKPGYEPEPKKPRLMQLSKMDDEQ
jgi:hypothetical protein